MEFRVIDGKWHVLDMKMTKASPEEECGTVRNLDGRFFVKTDFHKSGTYCWMAVDKNGPRFLKDSDMDGSMICWYPAEQG